MCCSAVKIPWLSRNTGWACNWRKHWIRNIKLSSSDPCWRRSKRLMCSCVTTRIVIHRWDRKYFSKASKWCLRWWNGSTRCLRRSKLLNHRWLRLWDLRLIHRHARGISMDQWCRIGHPWSSLSKRPPLKIGKIWWLRPIVTIFCWMITLPTDLTWHMWTSPSASIKIPKRRLKELLRRLRRQRLLSSWSNTLKWLRLVITIWTGKTRCQLRTILLRRSKLLRKKTKLPKWLG